MRSYLSSDIITVDYVKSNNNLTNPFAKALTKDKVLNMKVQKRVKTPLNV